MKLELVRPNREPWKMIVILQRLWKLKALTQAIVCAKMGIGRENRGTKLGGSFTDPLPLNPPGIQSREN
jgi:hypothetical protein